MSLDRTIILLPIWGRKAITLLCLKNLKELKEKYGIEVMCVVSESWAKLEPARTKIWVSSNQRLRLTLTLESEHQNPKPEIRTHAIRHQWMAPNTCRA